EFFHGVHGILVPGGFGSRGTEGKIRAIHYARTNGIPFLGICLGMQLAMVEYGRHKVGLANSNSEEFTNEGDLVVHYMEGQEKDGPKGGNMRLGAYQCKLKKGSLVEKIYGKMEVFERHRHRLEVNNSYVEKFEKAGIVVSGRNDSHGLVEIIEIPNHPFFVACQFHPEFKSRPYAPHPLFKGFIESSSSQS
ncbi:MAG: gamma-glutamyl-gamma-aminobutyrate hydrolase family protein, partial [Bdellovibrionota bacterium]|nr:gamma-glutamyl-gamma-aminobutyrate hydrolase family protein [Bdellovibrionota bacterium]